MLAEFFIDVLLQEGQGGATERGPLGGLGQLFLPLILIFFIFWLLVFRPESRRRREREQKVQVLKKGDQVITAGGIFGKVMKVEDNSVVVQIDKDKDVRARFSKTSIVDVTPEGEGAARAETGGGQEK